MGSAAPPFPTAVGPMNERQSPLPEPLVSQGLPFWQMQGISKRYGGVLALDDVDFACGRGSIHAVLGENGAGKSTLIKIAAGVVTPTTGRLLLEGREVAFAGPQDAQAEGIVCIFQEL